MFNYDLNELTKSNGGKYKVNNLQEAFQFCQELTNSHYENFPVASLLIPKNKRKYIFVVYSFARIADDIADEIPNKKEKQELLTQYKSNLSKKNLKNPIFLALEHTISKLNLSTDNFYKLLEAFDLDINFKRAKTWEETLYYCSKSANPVGRVILEIFNIRNPELLNYSDSICTALQLTNFWQDISIDKIKNRTYIPESLFSSYKTLNIYELDSQQQNEILNQIINYTEDLFREGKKLIPHLKPYRLKLEIAITLNAGMQTLNKIKQLNNNILEIRPKLYKLDYISIIIKSIF